MLQLLRSPSSDSLTLDRQNSSCYAIARGRDQEDGGFHNLLRAHPLLAQVFRCRLHRCEIRLSDDQAWTDGIYVNTHVLAFFGKGAREAIIGPALCTPPARLKLRILPPPWLFMTGQTARVQRKVVRRLLFSS